MVQKYIDNFFNLECSDDVLGSVGHVNNLHKEITEAMAIIRRLKDFNFRNKKYILIDLCSGNALVPIISAYLYGFEHNYAVDKMVRHLKEVDQFSYVESDIYSDDFKSWLLEVSRSGCSIILTSVHACQGLADRVIDLYKTIHGIDHLILMPCCIGKGRNNYPAVIRKKLGKDLVWVWDLYNRLSGFDYKKNLVRDNYVLSPRNYIITASLYYS